MASFGGVPFPYDEKRMPQIPQWAKGTRVEDALKNYPVTGTIAALTKKIDQVSEFAKQKNVPIFCGEFAVMMWTCLPEDRIRYYQFVRESLETRNIPWITWDYTGQCGLFNTPEQRQSNFKKGLNVELVRALGLTPP